MLKSVAGRQVPFNPRQFPTRLSRRVGLRTMSSIGGKAPFEFYDGFETGDFSKWDILLASPYDIITSPTHHGSYAAKSKVVSGALTHTIAKTITNYYIRLYCQLTGTFPADESSNDVLQMEVTPGGGGIITLVLATGGAISPRFRIYNNVHDTWADGITSLALGTWYCVEVKMQSNNASATHKLWLNGVEEVSFADTTLGYNLGSLRMTQCYWELYTGRIIIDCLISDPSTRPTCVYYPAYQV